MGPLLHLVNNEFSNLLSTFICHVRPGVLPGVEVSEDRFAGPVSLSKASFLSLTTVRAAQAAATTCYVATHPSLAGVSGRYFVDCNESTTCRLAADEREAARMWLVSESLSSSGEGDLGSFNCRLGSDLLPLS